MWMCFCVNMEVLCSVVLFLTLLDLDLVNNSNGDKEKKIL